MAKKKTSTSTPELAVNRIGRHFADFQVEQLVTVEKVFPATIRPDLEAAIESLLETDTGKATFAGISGPRHYQSLTFSWLVTERREPAIITAAEYMDIDIGTEKSGQCIVSGVWFFYINEAPAALLVSQFIEYGQSNGVRVEAIMSEPAGGRDEGQAILAALAKRLTVNSVYRGRALSFETVRSYQGGLGTLKVHKFPPTTLEQIILPKKTLETLERTVFGFISARKSLLEYGFSTKRGLLLYGAPGTGKTHFIRYLISQLADHTSMIVTAEQVAAFDEIMSIARALQPSIVVIEDADLLARSREQRDGDCSQMLLNSLLNHMDGLTDDAEILFVLTTNRPETMEEAIRDRPGRIDQAIEFPKPDAECRARLLELYRGKIEIAQEISDECVRRTENTSAAFIRELARRMAQFAILRSDTKIDKSDMRFALEEMLDAGSFTAKALGVDEV